uniref:NADH-ubiquinone oxidoreductase chain 1 n=1 Tax=Syphacia muris TaxID=451379 RepID=A0A347YCC8_9BILA|nr:NADH dehydrogenase subunit 1 [Syphacia muris]
MVIMFLLVLMIMIFLVQGVAYITLCERHLLGGSQQRVGPNKVSLLGLVQPIFDGLKLVKKEQLMSIHSVNIFFLVLPGVTFFVMYMEWFLVDYCFSFMTYENSILMFLCLIGFSVYSFLMSGVMSNSKYGVLGAVRVSNQSVSYEIVFSLYILCVIFFNGSYGFFCNGSVLFFLMFLPLFFVILAELNRAPFDFSEGESELVSGYNVEFGSVSYALFYIGEYGSLLFFSYFLVMMFFFGSLFVFFLIFCFMIFVRSSYPRFRYDMLMGLFWFVMLPLVLYFLWFFSVVVL